MEEKEALLYKEEGQPKKGRNILYNEDEASSSGGSDEWWENSHSSCSSCDSHSGSSYEWEAEVDKNGELFYIESDIFNVSEEMNTDEYQTSMETTYEEKIGKSDNVKAGRLVNWMRRRDTKKLQTKTLENSNETHQEISIVKENSVDDKKEFKHITVKVESPGQGTTLSEKLLGLSLGSWNDKNIVVMDISVNGPLQNCKDLTVGDIIHEINGTTVIPHNVADILGSLNFPNEVLLKIEKTKQSSKHSKYQSAFVKSLMEKNEAIDMILLAQPVGVVVVDVESQHLNKDDVIYKYPENCILSSCRGAFVTLFHLLSEITPNDECQSSSVLIKKQPTHVLYKSDHNFLLLLAIPQVRCTLKEATYIMDDLIRNLLFNHQTLKRCFEASEKTDLDRFFSLFFSRLLTKGLSLDVSWFTGVENVTDLLREPASPQFEDILPYATWVPLPKEAQIQIDDALNEVEANDIGHEVEDNVETQRLFNIIGSCLYHKGYLLASHLPKKDLLDVYAFCRQNCLIQLFRKEPIKTLVIWREVFPRSVNRGLPVGKLTGYPIPMGRWFLLIVGQGYDFLAMILEIGGCCSKIQGNHGPTIAYVEEAEDTLRHMQKLGISSLASQWIENNNRFKTITPEEVFTIKLNRKKENLLGFVKAFDGSPKSCGPNSPANSKSSDMGASKRSRSTQQETSEDSVSQTTSNVSEVSDENVPILGRRGERGRLANENGTDSDSSDSDWGSSRDSNIRGSTCSSGVDNFYLGDVGEVIPVKLTTGVDYLLFHYVHLDGSEGVLVNPSSNSKRSSPKMKEIIENFRRCSQIIHSILENSIKFKKNGQEGSKCFINKSLVAVKEHGVLFECTAQESDSHKKPIFFTYWIVGRLFFTPHPREVYVCYYDNAPQNLVEIAFRLGLSAAG